MQRAWCLDNEKMSLADVTETSKDSSAGSDLKRELMGPSGKRCGAGSGSRETLTLRTWKRDRRSWGRRGVTAPNHVGIVLIRDAIACG